MNIFFSLFQRIFLYKNTKFKGYSSKYKIKDLDINNERVVVISPQISNIRIA